MSDTDKSSDAESAKTPSPARAILTVIGVILIPIGVAGIILPVLPGIPLLILAAACFARSSPKLERWLITHPKLGPGIVAWRERGAIPLRAKLLALMMMSISGAFVALSETPLLIKVIVIASIAGAGLFVSTRPDR